MKTVGETRPLLDEQLEAVAHVERRRLLVALLEENPLTDVPDEIAELEDDAETLERRVAMRHNHLPRLDDYGFVQWDRKNDLVTRGPEFEKIRPLVTSLDEHRDGL